MPDIITCFQVFSPRRREGKRLPPSGFQLNNACQRPGRMWWVASNDGGRRLDEWRMGRCAITDTTNVRRRWTNPAFAPDRSCSSATDPGLLFSNGPVITVTIGRSASGDWLTPQRGTPPAPDLPRDGLCPRSWRRRRSSAVESAGLFVARSFPPEYAVFQERGR